MNRFIRFYNQNRKIIWLAILTVIAIVVLIQILNKFAYEKNNINNTLNKEANNTETFNNNYSVITRQEVKQEIKEVVDEFISLCNNKQIDTAYEMLSDECKEELYPTLEDFTKNYYNRIFDSKRTYACQAWITEDNSYTYRIDFVQDMLATGSPSKTSIVDYYTVVKENNEYKLNINKFIGMKNMNITTTNSNITINVKSKKIYMDYEIYDIEVINNSQNTIMLDDLQDTDNIYVEDIDKKQYTWYNHEIIENDITVQRGFKQEISIKFNKEYKSNNEDVKLVLSNIILNNEKTINMEINF